MPPIFHSGPLKEDRQFLMYRYRTVREADADFYKSYDASFLVRKADFLYSMYKSAVPSPEAQSMGEVADRDQEDFRTLLATELHCTAYHQTEALIALLLAEYQQRPDWVYLTSYGNSEIKEAAKGIVQGYGKIPGTSASNLRQLVKEAVYATWDLSSTDAAETWKESIENTVALLQIVSEQFVDGHEYNSYKHGLRVVLGSAAFGVGPANMTPENVRTIAVMPHSMTFLQIEKLDKAYGAHMVTKEAKPEYSREVITCMGALLTTIKTFRLARIEGALPYEVSLPVFNTKLLDQTKPATKFSFSY